MGEVSWAIWAIGRTSRSWAPPCLSWLPFAVLKDGRARSFGTSCAPGAATYALLYVFRNGHAACSKGIDPGGAGHVGTIRNSRRFEHSVRRLGNLSGAWQLFC